MLTTSMTAYLIIIPIVFFVSGSWLLYRERELIRLGFSSYLWAKTQGTIIDAKDDYFDIPGLGGRSGLYKETAYMYKYKVAGRTYHCRTYCFGGWSEKAEAAYLIGTNVPVFYNRNRPEEAVLRTGIQFGAVFGAIPIAIGLFYLIRSVYE